jgi:hypothetical protein
VVVDYNLSRMLASQGCTGALSMSVGRCKVTVLRFAATLLSKTTYHSHGPTRSDLLM